MAKLGTKVGLSSLYYLQADGQLERSHRYVEQILQYIVAFLQDNWDDMLVQAESALNETVHSAHGLSPFKVVYGWEPSLPIDHTFCLSSWL